MHTTQTQWKHCPGVDNPADYLSSGVLAEQLVGRDTWWRGPAWFSKGVESWPHDAGNTTSTHKGTNNTHPVLHIQIPAPLLEASRYSSYWRLLLVAASIFQFVRNIMRSQGSSGGLTASDLTQPRVHWIKEVQIQCFSEELDALQKNADLARESKITRFNAFLDNGFIRLGGRLQCADRSKDLRNTILLAGNHHSVYLLIWQTHMRFRHLGNG